MAWTRIPAYITGSVNQELLLRNEYLAAENRKSHLEGQAERATFGEIGFQLVLLPYFQQIKDMIRRELSIEVIL
jgi:hypothetical protein